MEILVEGISQHVARTKQEGWDSHRPYTCHHGNAEKRRKLDDQYRELKDKLKILESETKP